MFVYTSSNSLNIESTLFGDKKLELIKHRWLYGISTFIGYLMPNSFSYNESVLFQKIQFSISTLFKMSKEFYFK